MHTFRSALLFTVFTIQAFSTAAQAPQKTVDTKYAQWAGYKTTTRLTDRWSIWNDFHYNPGAFGVARTGVTMHLFNNQATWTNGYGFLWLTSSSTDPELDRHEHRPWGQITTTQKLTNTLSFNTRFRYEARFRQKVAAGDVVEGFTFNWRFRFLFSARQSFPKLKTNTFGTPFIGLTNEVLMNMGEEIVYNHLDQNRLWLTGGLQWKDINVQLGYMNRYVQNASGKTFVRNHTALLWVTQTFDLRRKAK
jgi:hypothetical protein